MYFFVSERLIVIGIPSVGCDAMIQSHCEYLHLSVITTRLNASLKYFGSSGRYFVYAARLFWHFLGEEPSGQTQQYSFFLDIKRVFRCCFLTNNELIS